MITNSSNKLPEIPDEHITGRRAVAVFLYRKKKEWVTNEFTVDYGRDILVTLREDGAEKEEFYVQLKGHNAPDYNVAHDFISEPIAVSTVRSLLQRTVPSMLCVCDAGNRDEPIYYVWIEEAVEAIAQRNSEWESQDSISLRVPTLNKLEETSHDAVEDYVRLVARGTALNLLVRYCST